MEKTTKMSITETRLNSDVGNFRDLKLDTLVSKFSNFLNQERDDIEKINAYFVLNNPARSIDIIRHAAFIQALTFPELEVPEAPIDETRVKVYENTGILVVRQLVVLEPDSMIFVDYLGSRK